MFVAPSFGGNEHFNFDTVAGRFIVLLFAGSMARPPSAEAFGLVMRNKALFDDERAAFFGVTSDSTDAPSGRIVKVNPGIRWFIDDDRRIARLYGLYDDAGRYRPYWLVLDPMLRVIARAPLNEGAAIMQRLAELVAEPLPEISAPVLIVPRVFDAALCRRLIDRYDANGGRPSGFMRENNGVTVGVHDHSFKRRSDLHIDDPELRAEIRDIFSRVLIPQIQHSFNFRPTRIERYIVACYDSDNGGGFFRAHRDNTTAGTAHRRFACSINLNAEEFEGGDLRFPEFGKRGYRPPTGGAAVFSCSLLHEATPVTRGKRYAYLPFFYDDAAAMQREAAAKANKLAPELSDYRA